MCYSFQLSVPGQEMLPAAGVTFVAVLPTHRRRGVLSSLMRRQLADVRDRGEPLAILWASESVIYARYGYGRASWHLDFTLHRGEGTLTRAAAAAASPALRLRLADPAGGPARAGQGLRRGCCRRGPGSSRATTRGGGGWSTTRRSTGSGSGPLRCLLAEDDSGPRGYALYSAIDTWDGFLPENVLSVRELMAADDAAASAALCDRPAQPGPDHRVPRRPAPGRRSAAVPAGRPEADPAEADRRPVGADHRRAPARWPGAGTPARSTWSSRCATRSCRPTRGGGG